MVKKIASLSLILSVLLFAMATETSYSQVGGRNVYEVLNFAVPARIAALGGQGISLRDKDLGLVSQNPAALSEEMHNSLTVNYVNYFAGINYGYIGYARNMKKYGNWGASILYNNYGKFTRADEMGNIMGEFTASDYVLSGTYSRSFDSVFHMGATVKLLFSQFDTYNSFGVALDYAATYQSKNKYTVVTGIIRNLGANIKAYNKGEGGPIPFELQLGVSHRFKYVPLRLSMVVTNLNRPNLVPDNPNAAPQTDPLTGEVVEQKPRIGDKIMRHFVFGAEIMPFKALSIRFGYNYQRRQEMKLATRAGLVGFSYGFGIRISKFEISYGRASYSLAGGTNHLTISTNIDSFKSKKKTTTDEKNNHSN